jgi:hypothetical protein
MLRVLALCLNKLNRQEEAEIAEAKAVALEEGVVDLE